MDLEGYRCLLETRKLTAEQIERSIEIVARFEEFLGGCQPSKSLEQATAQDALAITDILLAEGKNSFLELAAVARYGYFCKNFPVYVAILELLDGSEALEGMHSRVGEVLGEEKRQLVFEGIQLPELGVSNEQKARLTRTLMERIEGCTDAHTRSAIFSDSFRNLPDENYLEDRQQYERSANFDAYLEMKRSEFIAQLEKIRDEGGLYFSQPITQEVVDFVRSDPEISQGVRQGNILYVTKIPYQTRDYLRETDLQLIRYYYCHCPWARESLRQVEGPVPAEFCRCSAGYHKKPWEVIFGQKLEAEVLESVLQGDLRCRFAIHLPLSVMDKV